MGQVREWHLLKVSPVGCDSMVPSSKSYFPRRNKAT